MLHRKGSNHAIHCLRRSIKDHAICCLVLLYLTGIAHMFKMGKHLCYPHTTRFIALQTLAKESVSELISVLSLLIQECQNLHLSFPMMFLDLLGPCCEISKRLSMSG